jgi:hypothetical protein
MLDFVQNSVRDRYRTEARDIFASNESRMEANRRESSSLQ